MAKPYDRLETCWKEILKSIDCGGDRLLERIA